MTGRWRDCATDPPTNEVDVLLFAAVCEDGSPCFDVGYRLTRTRVTGRAQPMDYEPETYTQYVWKWNHCQPTHWMQLPPVPAEETLP